MTVDLRRVRIFIRPGKTDMRKAVNGLLGIIEREAGEDIFSGNVYMFCNRGRKLIKAIWWERNGFWLSQKRLQQETYPWPDSGEAVRELSAEHLGMLLAGIDFFKAHKTLHYKNIS